jgi:hypothetical protein
MSAGKIELREEVIELKEERLLHIIYLIILSVTRNSLRCMIKERVMDWKGYAKKAC